MKEVSDCLWDAFDVWNMSRERISNNNNGMLIPRIGWGLRGLDLDKKDLYQVVSTTRLTVNLIYLNA